MNTINHHNTSQVSQSYGVKTKVTSDGQFIEFSSDQVMTNKIAILIQETMGYPVAARGFYSFKSSEEGTSWLCSSSSE